VKEALLYDKLPGGDVKCILCPHGCVIRPNSRGICRVRENVGGTLFSLVHARAIALHVDPIEKKPLFHVHPGSLALSVGTVGCNLRCTFCQNAEISQLPPDYRGAARGTDAEPGALVELAVRERCRSIAYTYTEPTVFFEYALDTATLAKDQGLLNVFVTNGYMDPRAIETIEPYLDACNVDLKSFRDDFYRRFTAGRLGPVLETLEQLREAGVWIEVTTLIIPGLNDSDEELGELVQFIAGTLGRDTPWHVSRFFPHYRLTDARPTPIETLCRAAELGTAAGLRFVYMGNVPGEGGENTLCPGCGRLVVDRVGFRVVSNLLRDGACPSCGTTMPGIGMEVNV
jgi:pyruvate formate lyase activating enzyme